MPSEMEVAPPHKLFQLVKLLTLLTLFTVLLLLRQWHICLIWLEGFKNRAYYGLLELYAEKRIGWEGRVILLRLLQQLEHLQR